MSFFTSSREKRLWFWAFVVFAAILSTLFVGQPLARVFADQNVQAFIFVLGMILIGIAILVHGLSVKPGKMEIAILLGIVAVYMLLFLRLGLAERSHLIEYSILAIFIHKAITERASQGKQIPMKAMLAIIVTFLIGVFDECIQIFLPNRVFDPVDILFNGIVVTMAIGSQVLFAWSRKRLGKH